MCESTFFYKKNDCRFFDFFLGWSRECNASIKSIIIIWKSFIVKRALITSYEARLRKKKLKREPNRDLTIWVL